VLLQLLLLLLKLCLLFLQLQLLLLRNYTALLDPVSAFDKHYPLYLHSPFTPHYVCFCYCITIVRHPRHRLPFLLIPMAPAHVTSHDPAKSFYLTRSRYPRFASLFGSAHISTGRQQRAFLVSDSARDRTMDGGWKRREAKGGGEDGRGRGIVVVMVSARVRTFGIHMAAIAMPCLHTIWRL